MSTYDPFLQGIIDGLAESSRAGREPGFTPGGETPVEMQRYGRERERQKLLGAITDTEDANRRGLPVNNAGYYQPIDDNSNRFVNAIINFNRGNNSDPIAQAIASAEYSLGLREDPAKVRAKELSRMSNEELQAVYRSYYAGVPQAPTLQRERFLESNLDLGPSQAELNPALAESQAQPGKEEYAADLASKRQLLNDLIMRKATGQGWDNGEPITDADIAYTANYIGSILNESPQQFAERQRAEADQRFIWGAAGAAGSGGVASGVGYQWIPGRMDPLSRNAPAGLPVWDSPETMTAMDWRGEVTRLDLMIDQEQRAQNPDQQRIAMLSGLRDTAWLNYESMSATSIPKPETWKEDTLVALDEAGVLAVLGWADKPRQEMVAQSGEIAYLYVTGKEDKLSFAQTLLDKSYLGIGSGWNPTGFDNWVKDPANAKLIENAYVNGYTAANGMQFSGGAAVWELYINSKGRLARGGNDFIYDPFGAAATALTLGSWAAAKGALTVGAAAARAGQGTAAAARLASISRGLDVTSTVLGTPQKIMDYTVDFPITYGLKGAGKIIGGALALTPMRNPFTPSETTLHNRRVNAVAGAASEENMAYQQGAVRSVPPGGAGPQPIEALNGAPIQPQGPSGRFGGSPQPPSPTIVLDPALDATQPVEFVTVMGRDGQPAVAAVIGDGKIRVVKSDTGRQVIVQEWSQTQGKYVDVSSRTATQANSYGTALSGLNPDQVDEVFSAIIDEWRNGLDGAPTVRLADGEAPIQQLRAPRSAAQPQLQPIEETGVVPTQAEPQPVVPQQAVRPDPLADVSSFENTSVPVSQVAPPVDQAPDVVMGDPVIQVNWEVDQSPRRYPAQEVLSMGDSVSTMRNQVDPETMLGAQRSGDVWTLRAAVDTTGNGDWQVIDFGTVDDMGAAVDFAETGTLPSGESAFTTEPTLQRQGANRARTQMQDAYRSLNRGFAAMDAERAAMDAPAVQTAPSASEPVSSVPDVEQTPGRFWEPRMTEAEQRARAAYPERWDAYQEAKDEFAVKKEAMTADNKEKNRGRSAALDRVITVTEQYQIFREHFPDIELPDAGVSGSIEIVPGRENLSRNAQIFVFGDSEQARAARKALLLDASNRQMGELGALRREYQSARAMGRKDYVAAPTTVADTATQRGLNRLAEERVARQATDPVTANPSVGNAAPVPEEPVGPRFTVGENDEGFFVQDRAGRIVADKYPTRQAAEAQAAMRESAPPAVDMFGMSPSPASAIASTPEPVSAPVAATPPTPRSEFALFGSDTPTIPTSSGAAPDFTPLSPDQQMGGRQTPLIDPRAESVARADEVTIPRSAIGTDPEFQPRKAVDQRRVNELVDNWDPTAYNRIVVWLDPADGTYKVLAGHHRLEAMTRLGLEEIDAKVFSGSRQDAINFARRSNSIQAELTTTELARAVRQEVDQRLAESGRSWADLSPTERDQLLKDVKSAYSGAWRTQTLDYIDALHGMSHLPDDIMQQVDGMLSGQSARPREDLKRALQRMGQGIRDANWTAADVQTLWYKSIVNDPNITGNQAVDMLQMISDVSRQTESQPMVGGLFNDEQVPVSVTEKALADIREVTTLTQELQRQNNEIERVVRASLKRDKKTGQIRYAFMQGFDLNAAKNELVRLHKEINTLRKSIGLEEIPPPKSIRDIVNPGPDASRLGFRNRSMIEQYREWRIAQAAMEEADQARVAGQIATTPRESVPQPIISQRAANILGQTFQEHPELRGRTIRNRLEEHLTNIKNGSYTLADATPEELRQVIGRMTRESREKLERQLSILRGAPTTIADASPAELLQAVSMMEPAAQKRLEKRLRFVKGQLHTLADATPQEIMQAVGMLDRDLRVEYGINGPTAIGRALDKMNRLYSASVLSTWLGLPKMLFFNTGLGNTVQALIGGSGRAIPSMFNLGQWRAMLRMAKKNEMPITAPVYELAAKTGMGVPTNLTHGINEALNIGLDPLEVSIRSLEIAGESAPVPAAVRRAAGKSKPGLVSKFLDVFSKATGVKYTRELNNGLEWGMRTGLWGHEYRNLLKQSFNGFIDQSLDRASRMLGDVPIEDIRTALTTLGPITNPQMVADRMERLALSYGVSASDAAKFGDRVGRDWANVTRRSADEAVSRVNKVLFSFETTRLDEWARRVVPFHMWMSRAIPFYAEQMLRHPGLASAYYRAAQGIESEAEAQNWPPALKGFLKLWTGPAGLELFVNPIAALSILDVFVQANGGYTPENTTGIARVIQGGRQWGFSLLPWWESLLTHAGYLGESGRLDPLGTDGHRRVFGSMIQFAGAQGWLGEDWQKFIGTPYQDALANVREAMSGHFPGSTNIPATDQSAYGQEILNNIVLDLALEREGITRAEFDAMDINDPDRSRILDGVAYDIATDGPLSLQALDEYSTYNLAATVVNVLVSGPKKTRYMPLESEKSVAYGDGQVVGLPTTAGGSGNASGMTTPLPINDPYADGIVTKNEVAFLKQWKDTYGEPYKQGDLDRLRSSARNSVDFAQYTPESRPLMMAVTERRALATDEARNLSNFYYDIAFGTLGDGLTITVNGLVYRSRDLSKMTADERWAVADAWLVEHDPKGLVEDLKGKQDVFDATHAEYAMYEMWREDVNKTWGELGEGGLSLYRDQLSRKNPNAKRYFDEQRRLIIARLGKNASPEAVRKELDRVTLGVGAYMAIEGIKVKINDPRPLASGVDPRPPGSSSVASSSGGSSSGAGSSSSSKYATRIKTAVAAYDAMIAGANTWAMQNGVSSVPIDQLPPMVREPVMNILIQNGAWYEVPDQYLAERYYEWKLEQDRLGLPSTVEAYIVWVDRNGESATALPDPAVVGAREASPDTYAP